MTTEPTAILEPSAAESLLNIDSIKEMMDGFDPASLLPELSSVFDFVAAVCRIAVLAGPIILLALGLLYLFASPKEANYKFGYRCYFGMGSVYAWRYSQRLAGILFAAVGLILTLVMFSVTGKFQDMDIMDMLWKTAKCGIWEAVIILLTKLAINLTVAFYFDSKGHLRRRKGREPKANPAETEI